MSNKRPFHFRKFDRLHVVIIWVYNFFIASTSFSPSTISSYSPSKMSLGTLWTTPVQPNGKRVSAAVVVHLSNSLKTGC